MNKSNGENSVIKTVIYKCRNFIYKCRNSYRIIYKSLRINQNKKVVSNTSKPPFNHPTTDEL